MQRQRIKYLLMMCAGGMACIMSFSAIAHAETYVTEGLYESEKWTEANSPYVLENPLEIPNGVVLTVEPGVSIIASSSIDGYSAFYVQGRLILEGKPDKRITLTGFGGIDISSGTTSIKYSDISLMNGIYAYRSNLYLASSNLSSANTAIESYSSKVFISDSKISNNNIGLLVDASKPSGIFPVQKNDSSLGIGGIGNFFLVENPSGNLAQSNTVADAVPSSINIQNSSIINNTEAAIKNDDTAYVQAVKNWWGSDTGPSMWNENKIAGMVTYAPWLTKDPFDPTVDPKCCSNIIFIPGLEGTRLYRDEKVPIVGMTMTNQLWEPNRNADVEKLYLNTSGSSTDATIYSGGPVGTALGLVDVYGGFMDYLDSLSKNGMINEWKAFGYDWRKSIAEVVLGNEQKLGTTTSLIQMVNEMAEHSKTGKVTLITHSNGGLVAKYLVKMLSDIGKSDLVDSVISVAVPFLGTPQAIAGLLHGSNLSIAGGIILNESTARGLGMNMASAYSLLPSREYFSHVFGPTIAFASTTVSGINNGSYPKEISSGEDQSAFITDAKKVRTAPAFSDMFLPIKGNQALMAASDILHGILDPFTWPASIARWSIVGWGKDTIKGIVYSNKAECSKSKCNEAPSFRIEKTIMGDGTVVAPSAAYNSGTVLSLDLNDLSKQDGRNIEHSNMLGASSTMSVINNIITNNSNSTSTSANINNAVIDKISKIPGVTIGEPDYNKEPLSLVLSTHSPVDLHVYDSEGRHVGLAPKPVGLPDDVEEGLYVFFDEKIPGSSFERIPDASGGYENYISLPDNDGEKYQVVINGNDVGEFTYDVERVQGDVNLDKIEYKGIPVTPLTIATTTVSARVSENTPLLQLASTLPALNIDVDGNGSPDIIATSSSTIINSSEYFKSIRTTIGTLANNLKRGKDILKRLDKIDALIAKGKFKQLDKMSQKIEKRVGHLKLKNLSATDREKILGLIELYISQFE